MSNPTGDALAANKRSEVSEMDAVERVARAIYWAGKYPGDDTPFDNLSVLWQRSYLDQARAAIAALPQGEPVAYRWIYPDEVRWNLGFHGPMDSTRRAIKVEPLYTGPVPPTTEAGVRETLLEKMLRAILKYGELGNVDCGSRFTGGKKPASKDVWQFPRHMLTDIEAALSTSPSDGEV